MSLSTHRSLAAPSKDRADRLVGLLADYLSMRHDGGDVDDASWGVSAGGSGTSTCVLVTIAHQGRHAQTHGRFRLIGAFTASIGTCMTAVNDQPGIGWLLLLLLQCL